MDIKELNKRPNIEQNIKLHRTYLQFEKLITELRKKELPTEILSTINTYIDAINSISNSETCLKASLPQYGHGGWNGYGSRLWQRFWIDYKQYVPYRSGDPYRNGHWDRRGNHYG